MRNHNARSPSEARRKHLSLHLFYYFPAYRCCRAGPPWRCLNADAEPRQPPSSTSGAPASARIYKYDPAEAAAAGSCGDRASPWVASMDPTTDGDGSASSADCIAAAFHNPPVIGLGEVMETRSRLPTDVEATAVQVALYRSLAASRLLRPDGLPYYDGSYDTAIVNACMPVSEQEERISRHSHVVSFMAVCTAEIDHQILQVLQPGDGVGDGGGVRQVVLLGAGLDARAWRLLLPPTAAVAGAAAREAESVAVTAAAVPDVVFFELDSGGVEELKSGVLGAQPVGGSARRVSLTADLGSAEEALRSLSAGGHDSRRATVFVAEGLIGYLTAQAGDALLRAVRSVAAPGSRLLLSAPPSSEWRDELAGRTGVRLHHMTYEKADETLRRVIAAGWNAQLLTASELGQKYGITDNRFELIVGTC